MELHKNVLLILAVFSIKFGSSLAQQDNFKIRCYFSGTINVYEEYELNEALNLYQKFNDNLKIVLYVHGWREKCDVAESLLAIVNAFLQRRDHYVCVLNYDELAQQIYNIVVQNIPQLVAKVAFVLQNWIKNGLDYNKLHLIGFSLGAHICGQIGRTINSPGRKLPRISACDPAYPMFCDPVNGTSSDALSPNDACFVDVIHTDGGICGCEAPLIHADFYPNKGVRPQPGCGPDIWQLTFGLPDPCCHHAAIYYFANTVIPNGSTYLANNRQNETKTAQMGYNCPISASGNYDLVAPRAH